MADIGRDEFNAAFSSLREDMSASRDHQTTALSRLDTKIDGLSGQLASYSQKTASLETELRAVDRDLQQAKLACASRDTEAQIKHDRNWSWLMGIFGSVVVLAIGWIFEIMRRK